MRTINVSIVAGLSLVIAPIIFLAACHKVTTPKFPVADECAVLRAPETVQGQSVRILGAVQLKKSGSFVFSTSCTDGTMERAVLHWRAGAMPPSELWTRYPLPKKGEPPPPADPEPVLNTNYAAWIEGYISRGERGAAVIDAVGWGPEPGMIID